MPSVAPNGVPSGDGSVTPGATPQPVTSPPPTMSAAPSLSSAPSGMPTSSAAPSSSFAPSETTPFETEETPDGDGLVSSCRNSPPVDRPAPIVLIASYTYIVLVQAGASITDVLGDVEEATQYALADTLLRCTFSSRRKLQQSDIEYTFVSSLPQDEPSGDACDNVPAGQDCYVIDGGITLGYLPPQEESAVLDDIEAVLVENYDGGTIANEYPDIVALDFIGFNDGDTNGIIGGDTTTDNRSNRTITGVAVVVSTAVVAIAVLALHLFRRRHQNMTDESHSIDDIE